MIDRLAGLLRHLVRVPLFLALCVALILPGCANMGGEGDDPSDVCRADRVALRSTGNYFAQDILQGAAIGAVAGGLIGLAAGGNVRSAAIGAVAGGALGAAGGYWRARQKQYADQAQLYSAVYGDIQRENASIDKTQLAFNHLVACRNGEAATIRADYRGGRISRDLAANAMAGVRARSASDLRLASSISNHIQERSNDFSYASRQVETTSSDSGSAAPAQQRRRTASRRAPSSNSPAVQVEAASTTNVAKRDEFRSSIARAQSNQSAFEISPS